MPSSSSPMFCGVAGAAIGPQQHVGLDPLAGLETHQRAVRQALHRFVFLVVADHHALIAQVVAERVGDLVVEEGQQLRARVHQVHLAAHVAEDAGVLAADHPRAVDENGTGRGGHAEEGIAVEDARVVEIDVARPKGMGTGSDDEGVGGQDGGLGLLAGTHLQGVRIEESGVAVVQPDPVALVKIPAHGRLAGDDRFGGAQQVGIGQFQGVAERVAERRAGIELQHPVDGMPQRLGRDGAPVGATAADQMVFLDHRHRLPVFGGFHGGPFASRAGADHNHIVVLVTH